MYLDQRSTSYEFKFRAARIYQNENFDGFLEIGIVGDVKKTTSYRVYGAESLGTVTQTPCGMESLEAVTDFI